MVLSGTRGDGALATEAIELSSSLSGAPKSRLAVSDH